ncbi:MAG: hypothetical protein K9J16_16320 [Melioribacteraceae bacterium]|nr:hypothetical protein [Melioribacteraceae bacterium]MCF8395726.1 hypothetical protein [Melioribacteraceae bacterium]MCF8420877.1 hypothetical protein [Melioribacteraceae bacterium]
MENGERQSAESIVQREKQRNKTQVPKAKFQINPKKQVSSIKYQETKSKKQKAKSKKQKTKSKKQKTKSKKQKTKNKKQKTKNKKQKTPTYAKSQLRWTSRWTSRWSVLYKSNNCRPLQWTGKIINFNRRRSKSVGDISLITQ